MIQNTADDKSTSIVDPEGCLLTPVGIIGTGGYGTVYRCLRFPKVPPPESLDNNGGREPTPHSPLATTVAVKEILFDSVNDEPSDVLKEISTMRNICHETIVSFIASFFVQGHKSHQATLHNLAHSSSSLQRSKSSSNPRSSPQISFAAASDLPSGAVYLVEEFVEGCSVADLLASIRTPATQNAEGSSRFLRNNAQDRFRPSPQSSNATALREEQIASVVVDVLRALSYLHNDSRVVHRDVKSSNILLSATDGMCKLCDFGTSGKKESMGDERRTMIGTPGWMAPEVWGHQGSAVGGDTLHSFATDIWALGVTVLEMAMPTSPQQDPLFSQYVLFLSHMQCSMTLNAAGTSSAGPSPRPKFSALDSLLSSPAVADFVCCCLRRNPLERPTAEKLLRHTLITEHGVSSRGARKVATVKRMVDQVMTGHASPLRSSTLRTSQPQPQAPPSILHEAPTKPSAQVSLIALFQHQLDSKNNAEKKRFCFETPQFLEDRTSSDYVRNLPSPYATTAAHNASPSKVGTAFDCVIFPSVNESRSLVQTIFSIHRSCCPPQLLPSLAHPNELSGPYTTADLQSSHVTFEQHQQLMDDLLSAFHGVELLPRDLQLRRKRLIPEIRDELPPIEETDFIKAQDDEAQKFSTRFCEQLVESLATSSEDVELLQEVVDYFDTLQRNPFRHCHKFVAKALVGGIASNAPPRHIADGANDLHGEPEFDVLCAPSIPVPMKRMQRHGNHRDLRKHHTGTGESGAATEEVVDVVPILYNKWLAESKSTLSL